MSHEEPPPYSKAKGHSIFTKRPLFIYAHNCDRNPQLAFTLKDLNKLLGTAVLHLLDDEK